MPGHEVEKEGNYFGIQGILLYVRLVVGAIGSGIIGYVVPMLKIQVSSPIQWIAITHGLITLQIPFGSALVDLLFTGQSTRATNSKKHRILTPSSMINFYAVCPLSPFSSLQIRQKLDTKTTKLRRNCVEKNTVNS